MSVSGTHAEGQLQALIGTAVDGIMSIDRRGIVDLYNPACERIFGWAPFEVIGRNVSMLMPARYAEHHDDFLIRYISSGEARIIGIGREVEGLRKDGTEFPMDLSVGEFETADDRRFVGIVRDLTERVAAERRLRELQAQLSHMGRVSAVAEMGTALAHELNQPLTAIALFLAAAEKSLDHDTPKVRSLFARAQQESQRAGDIVRRIRQMVERGDDERHDIDLRDLITGAAELCSVADVDGRMTIDISGAQTAITIYADATQIRQVLVNLLRNAMDATVGQDDRTVRVRTRCTATTVVLEVEDNGRGIDPAVLPRLFSPFVTSKADGLGIGLSICRTIAESHGGSLELADQRDPGRPSGACFRLVLPLS